MFPTIYWKTLFQVMNRKLPVWQIFTRALYLVWDQRLFALAISWPVVILSGLLGLAVDKGFFDLGIGAETSQTEAELIKKSIDFSAGLLAYLGLQFFLLAIVAVYWHRNVLLQETTVPAVPFRFDAVLWRYIGFALLVLLVTFGFWFVGGFLIAFLALVTAESGTSAATLLLFLLITPGVLIFLVVLFRVSLALPAAAIGHKGFGLKSAWRATRGNNLRILGLHALALLFGICIGLVEAGITQVLSAAIGTPPAWFQLGLNAIVNFAYVLLGIGLLSLSYAYLIYDMPKEDARMEP